MERRDFQQIAALRLKETQALLRARQYSGAYYLGGYVVECALKACIARQTRRYAFPDKELVSKSYTHDLTRLIDAANLKDELAAERRSNAAFDANWKTVILWTEQSRYARFA